MGKKKGKRRGHMDMQNSQDRKERTENGADPSVSGQNAKSDERIEEYGQVLLDEGKGRGDIYLLSVIGEIEGHENLNSGSKTTNAK